MAYAKLISAQDIVETAVRMIDSTETDGLSLRAVAASLGVKAPSLYRYFAHKDALELAVAEEAVKAMLAELGKATPAEDPETRFRATVEAYLRFARKRFPLYSFLMQRIPQTYGSISAKQLWNLLLDAASAVSQQPDDTAAAVAVWSFLHGYAVLQHSGSFGVSGPRGALDLGVTAFLKHLGRGTVPVPKSPATRATAPRRSGK